MWWWLGLVWPLRFAPPSCGSCGAAEIARGSGTGEAPYVRAQSGAVRGAASAIRGPEGGRQGEGEGERESVRAPEASGTAERESKQRRRMEQEHEHTPRNM